VLFLLSTHSSAPYLLLQDNLDRPKSILCTFLFLISCGIALFTCLAFEQKGNLTLTFSCAIDLRTSLFWNSIDLGTMTFQKKRKLEIPSLHHVTGGTFSDFARHLPHLDHHHLIGGILYVLNYAPGLGADIPVSLYLDKKIFQKVTVDIPAFEIEIGISFKSDFSSNDEDLNFDERYVVGSRAIVWDLQERIDPISTSPSEKPYLSFYFESSCSATEIVSCTDMKNVTTEDDTNAAFDDVAFLKPIFKWVSDLRSSNSTTHPLIYFRQTPGSDVFYSSLLGRTHKLGFQHLSNPTSANESHADFNSGGKAARRLVSLEEQCFKMYLDDDFSLLACLSINDGSWMTAEVNFLEDRTNNAILLLPYIKEHFYLSAAIDSSLESIQSNSETFRSLQAPLIVKVDDSVLIDGLANARVVTGGLSKKSHREINVLEFEIENKNQILVNGSISSSFDFNRSTPRSSSVDSSAGLDIYGIDGNLRWNVRPDLFIQWTGDDVSMTHFHGPTVASWKGNQAANFTASGKLLVRNSEDVVRMDSAGDMLLGYDGGADDSGKYTLKMHISEQFQSNGHLLTFDGHGNMETSDGDVIVNGMCLGCCSERSERL